PSPSLSLPLPPSLSPPPSASLICLLPPLSISSSPSRSLALSLSCTLSLSPPLSPPLSSLPPPLSLSLSLSSPVHIAVAVLHSCNIHTASFFMSFSPSFFSVSLCLSLCVVFYYAPV